MLDADPSALTALRERVAVLERAASEAAGQLSLVIESLADGFVLYDRDDRLVLCNARCREIYALSADAMVEGARFEDIVRCGLARGQYAVPAGAEAAWLDKRLRDHRAACASIEQQLGDGRWLLLIERPAPDGGRVGLRIDITDRKRQEQAIIAAKSQLEATLSAIPDMLFEIDGDGRFLACHVDDPRRLLVPPERLSGRLLDEVLPADVVSICHAAIDEARAHGRSTGMQYRLELADGPRWFELSIARKSTGLWPGGERSDERFIVLVRDVTERKELERSLAAERDFLEQIMATSLSAIVAIDATGELVFANKAAERVLGVEASTATGRRFDDPAWRVTGLGGEPFPVEESPFARVMATGEPVFDVRHAIEWPDGTRRLLSVNAAPLAASAGSPWRVVCSVTDITDQVRAESDLRYKEALMRGLFELCPVGIALTDYATGAFIDVNQALLDPLGYSREELLRLTYYDITPEEYHADEPIHLKRLAEVGRYGPFEKENVRKDGSRFPVLLSGTMVTDLDGRRLIWSIVEDITERKAAEAQILRQAHYDELTGLPNRRLFQDRLREALERARRGRHIGAVAMLDLDDFKTVNDRLGHWAGDAVMVEAADRLRTSTRATDTVARFGGDEFLVLFDDIASTADVRRIALEMRSLLARPFRVAEHSLQLGVSIGVCLFPADGDDVDELLRLADMAMYRAKREGRNRVRLHGESMPEAADEKSGEPRRR